MDKVTIPDIGLQEYTLENLPLLRKLRAEHFAARPQVCVERARHITDYLRDKAVPSDSREITAAKAVHHFLSRKEPHFFDDNLLAGSTTSKPYGAPVYPEFTGLTIWPELDTIGKRTKNPQALSKEDADELNFRIFPFWMERSIQEYARRKNGNTRGMRLFEQLVFFLATKTGCISHTVPSYRKALETGLEGIIAEAKEREARARSGTLLVEDAQQAVDFYTAVRIAMEGIMAYAANLAQKARELSLADPDADRRAHFARIADVCGRVPAKPATSFREAVTALWIIQVAIHGENINMAMSPGRLDQVLYPYYKKDRERGTLEIKDALELVGCLWLKLTDNTNLVPEQAEELFGGAGTVPAVTLGGVDDQGNDAVNDLTYIMLRATELLRTRDPSLNARYHYQQNSKTYRDRVAEVVATTGAVPAFHNDAAAIATLERQGTRIEHARDYAVIGCVELASAGRSYDASSSIMFNMVSALELALHNGRRPITGDEKINPRDTGDPASFRTFNQFWNAFTAQITFLMDEAIELNNSLGRVHQEIMPTPLLSAFFEGPMDKGKDLIFGGAVYNSSGVTHIGFADTVDSLNAIEKAVFIDKKCTFDQLLSALKADFQGPEAAALGAWLANPERAPKYGTDDPLAIKNSRNLVKFLYDYYQSRENYRGGKYRSAYWSMTNHAGQGRLAGALPNGRRANQVFSSGITPVSRAAGDLTTCLAGVAALDTLNIPGGVALNIKFPRLDRTKSVSRPGDRGSDDIVRLGDFVEGYFEKGGLHVQFNIISDEMLRDAKQNAGKYPELLVRVSGYSAYFNDLNDAMKDEIITRTSYQIKNGIMIE